MSYILDALRRAEAERERGHVPGLHSQPLPAALAGVKAAPRVLPWALVGSVLAVGAAGAWWWLRTPVPPAVVATAPMPMPIVAAPPAAAAVVPAPVAPPVIVPAPAPAPAVMSAPAPAAVVPAPATIEPAPPPAPPAVPAPAPAEAPVASAPATVIAFEQLPDDLRHQLPAVQIGGAIYSDNAANRMLIVAGQLLREGDAAAPGVTLEQIKPRSAVLRWKGLRYEVSF